MKQEFVSIIDAIEKTSDAELRELAQISKALKQLSSHTGSSVAANDSQQPASDTSALVITRRLKRTGDLKDNNGDKSAVERDGKINSDSFNQDSTALDVKVAEKIPLKGPENGGTEIKGGDEHTKIRTYLDVMEAQGQSISRQYGTQPSRAVRQSLPMNTSAANDNEKGDPRRDSSGRFVSRDKAAAAEQTKQQKIVLDQQGQMQGGFFNRLGKMLGNDRAGASTGESNGSDMVGGAAVGGPIWTLGKGVADIAGSVKDNVVSIQKWADERKEGKENKLLQKPTPAKTHPTQLATPPPPPVMGQRKSEKGFGGPLKDAAADATQEQTRIIDINDQKIIDVLDDIKKAVSKQGGGGIGFGDLFGGRRGRRGRSGRGGGGGSRGRDKGGRPRRNKNPKRDGKPGRNNRVDDLSTPDKPNGKPNEKPNGKPKPKPTKVKVPKPRGPAGKLKAIFDGAKALKVAGSVAAGGAAATTAATQLANAGATSKAAAHAGAGAAEKAAETTSKAAAQAGASAGTKAAAAGAGTATAATVAKKVVTETAADAGAKTAAVATKNTAEAVAKPAAAKAVAPVAEKAGEAGVKEGALKAGGKLGAKTMLKAVPLIGTAIGVGLDAYEGATDTEGQRRAFNLEDGEEVSTQQKTAYSMANVLNMGGLISGGAGLLASGARAMGMEKVADALTFDTDSIAKGLDSGMSTVRDAITKAKESSDDQNKEIATAISDGTSKTVAAINHLGYQLQGGTWGEDNVGVAGKNVSDYNEVQANEISPDLNIGGKNSKVRSFRNNNFGNLNYIGQEGARLEDPNGKGEARFAKFNTPEEGFRALAQQLTLYSNGKSKATGGRKLNTVEDIIKVYAPENENETGTYINSLSQKMGVKSNQQLDMTNPEVMTQLMRGIATIEGGNPQVTDQFIRDSIGTHENGKWVGGKFSAESLKVVNGERMAKGLAPIAENSLFSTGEKVATAADPAALKPSGTNESVPAATKPSPAQVLTTSAAVVAATPNKVDSAIQEQAGASEMPGVRKNRPDAGVTEPIKAPVSDVKAQKIREKTAETNKEGTSGKQENAWDKTKSAVKGGVAAVMAVPGKVDGAIQEQMTEYNVSGMKKNRPTAGLTMPEGIQIPSSLALASLPPSEIAKQTRATRTTETIKSNGVEKNSAPAGAKAAPAEGGSVTSKSDSSTMPKKATAAAVAVPEESLFDKALTGATDGLKAVGSSILPAVGDTLNQTVSGFSGNQMVGDLMGAAGLSDPSIQRAISPITDKAGSWLDGGFDSIKGATTALLSDDSTQNNPTAIRQKSSLSIPSSMPSVQDLANSGIRPALSTDTANYDVDMLKELQGMGQTLEKLLTETKQKGDAPEKVVHTAQPAPRQSTSLSIKDGALSELLRD